MAWEARVGKRRDGAEIHGTFIQASRSWYAETALSAFDTADEVWIMARGDNAADLHEFGIRWHVFRQTPASDPPSPQLGMFPNAWEWFDVCPALFAWLSEHQGDSVTPEQVCQKLLELGFEDETEEVNPETGVSRKRLPVGIAPPEAKGGK